MTMTLQRRVPLLLLLWMLACTITSWAEESETAPQPPLKQPESWQNDLVEWLLSKPGGAFSDKILWTKTEMGYNMHAAQNIDKGYELMIIPPSALIDSNGTGDECITIAKMMNEYDKGADGAYYPYIRYLYGGHEGGTSARLLPTTWSKQAKTLLRTIVGKELPPQRIEQGQRHVLHSCSHAITDAQRDAMDQETHHRWQDAYIFWLSRSWSDKMVPILDMINHRNGKWFNVESTTAHAGEPIHVYATRDIQKGEQLWNSYNECLDTDCQGGRIKYEYVTPNILMDYGFVEAYPRRFIFEVDRRGGKYMEDDFLIVEIDEDPQKPGTTMLDWHYATPSEHQLAWIRGQLERLKSIEDEIVNGVKELESDHEKNTVQTYYNAWREAFELALKHQDDEVSNKTTIFDDDEEL